MTSRDAILTKIRNARSNAAAQVKPADNVGIESQASTAGDLLGQFIALARAEVATVDELGTVADVPAAVARYLEEQGLGNRIVLGPDSQIGELDWQSVASLKCSQEAPDSDGDTVITACYAAMADSGALVVVSSPNHPVELNFLPANHIVVLRQAQVLADFEQLWTQLRRDYAGKPWPRCINLIVGPSRTADLGFPPKMGAHGPGRVHILVV